MKLDNHLGISHNIKWVWGGVDITLIVEMGSSGTAGFIVWCKFVSSLMFSVSVGVERDH